MDEIDSASPIMAEQIPNRVAVTQVVWNSITKVDGETPNVPPSLK